MSGVQEAKRNAALEACERVKTGMVVGLGTGSTAEHAVKRLGERVGDEGFQIQGVPTSLATEKLAKDAGIPLVDLNDVERIDVTIDGADEVDPQLDLIKGLGGALLREKIVASITSWEIIIVDETKLVDRLGTRSPLPVEVLPFGWQVVARRIRGMGHDAVLRERDGAPFVTDNGNHVLDVRFNDGIQDAPATERALNNLPGVVENGLFLDVAKEAIVGTADGKTRTLQRTSPAPATGR